MFYFELTNLQFDHKFIFLSVVANVPKLAELVITQGDDYVSYSQFISSIWRFFRKLVKYFNGAAISTSLGVFFVIFTIDLNVSQSAKVAFDAH